MATLGQTDGIDQQKLRLLLDSANDLASTLTLSEVLDHILRIGGELTDSEAGSLILHDPTRDDLYFAAATGPAAAQVRMLRIPRDKGKAGSVFATGRPLIENEIKDHYAGVDDATRFVTRSLICVPLQQGGERQGVLQFVNKRGGGTYGDAELELTSRLAVQATIAIRNAQLFERLLVSCGLYAKPENRSDLVALVTGHDAAARQERATIMFADMRGFTRFCADLNNRPDRIQLRLREFFHMLSSAVLVHNGIVNKALGDGILALFRGPDAAWQAAQCAFEMRRRFAELHECWKQEANVLIDYLDLGIGIASDEVMIGAVGDEVFRDFTVIGPAVNLARALEREARDGHFVLCDQLTCNAIGKRGIKPSATLRLNMARPGETQGPAYPAYHIEDRAHTEQPRMVFVSHAAVDRPDVERLIVQPLRQLGYEIWIAPDSIPPGQTWDKVIYDAIDGCFCFVVVVTRNAGNSQYVRSEVLAASSRSHLKDRIIPLQLDDTKPGQVHIYLEPIHVLRIDRAQAAPEFITWMRQLSHAAAAQLPPPAGRA